ncbi:MAG: tRNA adenosine(34) deaminase TadA [Bacillota bacterium]|nr:tRNA adenosine(34) deaminase TadA [Bacillota bacterium]
MTKDELYMSQAVDQAILAGRCGEVPIGAVIVQDGKILAADRNRREELNDATAHAEVLVIRQAGNMLAGWRLPGCTVYVTLEPCPMCAGALVLARIDRLVFGAHDPKGGAAGTLLNIVQDDRLNHTMEVTGGVMEEECSGLLKEFFREKRE